MSTPNQCPKCGRPLSNGEPGGAVCPACLLEAGMQAPPATTPFKSKFSAPSIAELAPHFPQLELLELLGQGGMGAVYKAKQKRLDRYVALKILPKTAGQEAEFATRFAREAQTLAKLNHPNIVAIHDYGEAGGWFFFTMEYVDGVNLRQAIQAKSVEPKEALSMVGQVCDALQYAHEEGVVHRDIKPENILLDKRGRLKIADFGLAKLLGQVTNTHRLTHTHQVMGTVGYMAPEQMEGSKEVDHRADLYALGVVFYELLTGELPLGRFAPPSQKVHIDVRIDEVVLKTLEKEPARRYQQASLIKQDVERISSGAAPKTSIALPSMKTLTQSMPWLSSPIAAGVALLVLGALEFALFFLGMFQIKEIGLTPSEYSKMWLMFTMMALIAGAGVAAAGLLILLRRFWLLTVLGAIIAAVPLAPLASLLRDTRDEATLAHLIELAEKQGINLNTSSTEAAMKFSAEARTLRDRIMNLAQSPSAKMNQLIYARWPTILVTWLSVPAGIWALVLLFQPAIRGSFSRRFAAGGMWQTIHPRFVNSNLLALLLCGVGLLGCITWVLIFHIQLAKSIQSIPASTSFSALESWQGTIMVITLAATALYLLFQMGRVPKPSWGGASALLAAAALLIAMLLSFAYSIDASLPGMYVNLVNRKLGAAGANFHLNVSDIMQLRHTPTEGLVANWVAAIGLLLVGAWQMRAAQMGATDTAATMIRTPQSVSTNDNIPLQLGLGLASVLLVGLGVGFLVWIGASLYRDEQLVMPFHGMTTSVIEALAYAVGTALPGLIALGCLLRLLWRSRPAEVVALVLRIVSVLVMVIGVAFTIWIVWLLMNEERLPVSLAPVIRFYSEALGWGAGMLTGALVALLIGWWPIKLPQNKWYYWAIGVLAILILIGLINYLFLRAELVPIPPK